MASLNDLVAFFQNNPQIITQLTSGKLDLNGILSVLKQQGLNVAQKEVEEYIAKNFDLGNLAGQLLGGGAAKGGVNAGDILGGLGSLLGGK